MHEWLESLNLLRLSSPTFYIMVFVMSFILGWLGTFFMQWFSRKVGFADIPSTSKFHNSKVALGGGIPIFLGFIIPIMFVFHFSTQQKGIIIGGLVTLILGLLDDIKKDFIPATVKLSVLFILTFILTYKYGVMLDLFHKIYLINMIFTLFWIVGIISAWNATDNMDGLAGGYTIIASVSFMLVAINMKDWWMAMTAVALAGSTLGFLPFNFNPKNKIFMGDSGSYFIGYTLAAMGVLGEWTTNSYISCVIPVLILSIPIFDLSYTVYYRHKTGVTKSIRESIDHSAPDHLSHRLVALGLSPVQAVIFLWVLGICLALSGILLRSSTQIINTLICLVQAGMVLLLIIILVRLGETKSESDRSK